jgi:tRNA(Arg) A34 adenosine deaminase TadA
MSLGWDAYRVGTLPIGAAVVDVRGHVVAQARSHRHEDIVMPGQLANTRIAHAEVNALAQLPSSGRYEDHVLYANVEPCCLCLGAVLQTGIGGVRYGWRDRYAGATTSMTVQNPQVARRCLDIEGPIGGVVGTLTGLLIACHYIHVRPGPDHVTAPWRQAEPALFAMAADAQVKAVVARAAALALPLDGLIDGLLPLIAVIDR